jgi:uncharacterized membrane protein YeaQ/YmgE (transglycosylase-associated protein family)
MSQGESTQLAAAPIAAAAPVAIAALRKLVAEAVKRYGPAAGTGVVAGFVAGNIANDQSKGESVANTVVGAIGTAAGWKADQKFAAKMGVKAGAFLGAQARARGFDLAAELKKTPGMLRDMLNKVGINKENIDKLMEEMKKRFPGLTNNRNNAYPLSTATNNLGAGGDQSAKVSVSRRA